MSYMRGKINEPVGTHISLFSGIGGIDLAAEQAGFKTVAQCEMEDYPHRVLCKHWPQTKKWRDVRDVTKESVVQAGLGPPDLLLGGFPCQPHSVGGKRLGSDDERDMWHEFARVIRVFNPGWVLAENVLGLLSSEHGRFFGRILRDLAQMGRHAVWGSYGAYVTGANNIRERVFILAYPAGLGGGNLDEDWFRSQKIDIQTPYNPSTLQQNADLFVGAERVLSNTSGRLYRNDDGLSEGVDRLKCIGNAVNPNQVYPILAYIAQIIRHTGAKHA